MFDRNISIYLSPGTEIWKQVMSTLPFPYTELAERLYIATSSDDFDNITKNHLLGKESFLFIMQKSHLLILFGSTRGPML